VGGIVRDILSDGRAPAGVMDPLRFGARSTHPDTARVLPGVVAGVGGYGNCLGLPNIGGEVVFDPCPTRATRWSTRCAWAPCARGHPPGAAPRCGQQGGALRRATGGDGIGGSSVLASGDVRRDRPEQAPQRSRSATRSWRSCSSSARWSSAAGLIEGIQDLGARGISCATSELASNGDGGMHVWLDRVPLRDRR
jgi:phosphoribosylformylglycinamidine synthase